MDNKAFELDTYLERLDYSGVVQPTEDRLEALHLAQVYTIPFENFDILLGRGISLALKANFGIDLDAPYDAIRPLAR